MQAVREPLGCRGECTLKGGSGHRVALSCLAAGDGIWASPDRIGAAWLRETETETDTGTDLGRSQVSECNIHSVVEDPKWGYDDSIRRPGSVLLTRHSNSQANTVVPCSCTTRE